MKINNQTKFDEIGVILGKDSYGKFFSKLVLFRKGKPVEWHVRTENRALAYALKDCRDALDEISLGLNRRELEFDVPPAKRKNVE